MLKMLIASDLLLLLTDDSTGKLRVPSNQIDIALGGALLTELAIARRVAVAGEAAPVRRGRALGRNGPVAGSVSWREHLQQASCAPADESVRSA